MGLAEIFGSLSLLSLFLFAAGITFLVIEMFIPGFGVFGFLGLFLIIGGIIASAKSLVHGVILGGISIIVIFILFIIFIILAGKGLLPRKMILFNREDPSSGYVAVDHVSYNGKEGVALTNLRPSGMASIDGENLSVVSEGEFIKKGASLKVKDVEGSRIIVEEI
ncbi:MAG: hypothetical protein GX222_08420 [Ruminococcaceae bacterium]|nr:hypothetical protein [Oscillospiraceae bacterium]